VASIARFAAIVAALLAGRLCMPSSYVIDLTVRVSATRRTLRPVPLTVLTTIRAPEVAEMADEKTQGFLDRVLNDPQLRSKFRSDPDGTIREAGLDDQQRQALAGTNWSEVSDEELVQRISKSGRIHP
jgi:hypothetical protein